MTQLTTVTNDVFDLAGLDDIPDLSGMSLLDASSAFSSQPRNIISIQGKEFTYKFADGHEEDGGNEIEVVILKDSPYQYKTLYEGGFEKGDSKLICFSSNAKAPDKWVTEPKSPSCATCEYNVKLNSVKPCKDHKNIVVLPSAHNTTPFVMSLPVTAMISFRNYVNELTAQLKLLGKLKTGLAPVHLFVTKLSFKVRDAEGVKVSYPALDFKRVRTVPAELWNRITELGKSDEIKHLLRMDDDSLAQHNEPSAPNSSLKAEEPESSAMHVAETTEPVKAASPKKAKSDIQLKGEQALAELNENSFAI